MDNDLNELHNLATTTFQNVTNLTPALRQMVANAKIYQKSVQATCNLAVMFIESLQNVANAAMLSEGATKKLGDVLLDIIDGYKEIENMKLELSKLFINEVIIPLESRAEIEIGNMKVTHKSYNQENKIQTELAEKARAGAVKAKKKKNVRKKKSPKSEEKEKTSARMLIGEEEKLKKVREQGLRKALIEERRVYCFVAERMCAYGRGMVIYNNRISNFVNQKIPDWQQFIAKPTELPAESEEIISNPTGFKMGTVRRKISKHDKKESLKRGKTFNNHFPTKYSTMDGRASREGSRPSLSSVAVSSRCSESNDSPRSKSPANNGTSSPVFPTPTKSDTVTVEYATPNTVCSLPEKADIKIYTPPEIFKIEVSSNTAKSEYANLITLNKDEDINTRSHSFSVPKNAGEPRRRVSLNRTESAVCDSMKKPVTSDKEELVESMDFTTKLQQIQQQLSEKLNQQTDPSSKSRLKALYDHTAQDASQLSFEKDDIIIPICEPTAGWQYGESEKTSKSGWFPSAFTEEVLISSTGEETQVIPPINNVGRASKKHHGPPPVLKKYARVKNRKISATCGPLTKPVTTVPGRRSSHGNVPQISQSNSMPQMIHMVEKSSGHARKHSNSFQGIDVHDDQDSFDDSTEDLMKDHITDIPPPPPDNTIVHDDNFDAMPPPPPPPLEWNGDADLSMLNLVDDNENQFKGLSFTSSIASS